MNNKYLENNKESLKDKIIIIIGSTQGIGAETNSI